MRTANHEYMRGTTYTAASCQAMHGMAALQKPVEVSRSHLSTVQYSAACVAPA